MKGHGGTEKGRLQWVGQVLLGVGVLKPAPDGLGLAIRVRALTPHLFKYALRSHPQQDIRYFTYV